MSQQAREERLAAVLGHPLHQSLGVRSIESVDGVGRLAFEAKGLVLNPAGMLHGGVVYALCDVCAYAGLLSLLADDEEAVTHDLHVSVMRPVGPGQTVTIESHVARRGRALCFIDVTATADGKLVASARVTKSIVRAEVRAEG